MGEFLNCFRMASDRAGYTPSVTGRDEPLMVRLRNHLFIHLGAQKSTSKKTCPAFKVLALCWPMSKAFHQDMGAAVQENNAHAYRTYEVALSGREASTQGYDRPPTGTVEPDPQAMQTVSNRRRRELTPENLIRTAVNGRKKFDAIILLNALEHVDDPAGLLRVVRKRLNPKGAVFVAAHAKKSLRLKQAAQDADNLRHLARILHSHLKGTIGKRDAIREIRNVDGHRLLNYSSPTALINSFNQDAYGQSVIARAVTEGYLDELPRRLSLAMHGLE